MPQEQATVERASSHADPSLSPRLRERSIDDLVPRTRTNEEIERRLAELNREWTSERTFEAGAATLVVAGSLLAAVRSRRWIMLTALVGGFLLQHALQGWCPPLSAIRRSGLRTQHEVDAERAALMRQLTHREENEEPMALVQQAGWNT